MPFDPEDKETKAAIAAAVKEAVEEATDGLAAKNRELLGELKKARKGKDVDPAELDRLESENDQLKADLAKVQREAKKTAERAEKSEAMLNEERSKAQKLAIDNGVQAALSKVNVAPHFSPAAAALMKGKVSLSDDGQLMVGDKPLEAHVAEWSQSDEGKHYIAAPNNSGGGGGGGSGGGAKVMTRSEFDSKQPAEKAAFVKDGGKVTDE